MIRKKLVMIGALQLGVISNGSCLGEEATFL